MTPTLDDTKMINGKKFVGIIEKVDAGLDIIVLLHMILIYIVQQLN